MDGRSLLPDEFFLARQPMKPAYKILLIGGDSLFGSRLCERLALDPKLRVIISGENPQRTLALADEMNRRTASERFSALRLELDQQDLSAQIRASGARAVIHAGAPFQRGAHSVALACIRAQSHYVDPAGGRDFAFAMRRFDGLARAAGVLAVSGANPIPTLSAAAADALAQRFSRIQRIDIGWQGVAGLHAVFALAGRGLVDCDVPDQALLAARYPGGPDIRCRAALELPALRFGFLMLKALHLADAPGSGRGAMHVELEGKGMDGRHRACRWTLVARDGAARYLPTLACAALAGKLARRQIRQRGARDCMGLLRLQDFIGAMQGLSIVTEIRDL
jgi:hypothetical protein